MAVLRWKRKGNGYLLVEWLTGIFLYGIVFSGLYMGFAGYEKSLAMVQVESAARVLAQDLQLTQKRALAGSDGGYIIFSNDHKGYWVYRRPNLVDKKRDFASAGSETLRFSRIPAYKIRFSVNGSPSASGQFILQHEKIKSAQVKVSLQSVTGRVQIERVSQ